MDLETQAMTGPVTDTPPMPSVSRTVLAASSTAKRGRSGTDGGERLIVAVENAAWTWRARALAGPMDTVRVKSTQYES